MNGLVNSDRTFHPAMEEIKKVYQDSRFTLANSSGTFSMKIENQYFFTNLNEFDFQYERTSTQLTYLILYLSFSLEILFFHTLVHFYFFLLPTYKLAMSMEHL